MNKNQIMTLAKKYGLDPEVWPNLLELVGEILKLVSSQVEDMLDCCSDPANIVYDEEMKMYACEVCGSTYLEAPVINQ